MIGGGGDSFGFDDATELHLRHRAKEELRKRMRAVRRAIPREARAARSARIVERVTRLDAWASARVIASYAAMRGEVDLGELLEQAHASGRTVALPRVDWSEESMRMHRAEAGAELEESGMGFDQPSAACPLVDDAEVDLVLMPALAADERGYRIGWGRGFYDRLLPLMGRATRVAVIFDFQLIAEVPNTPGDELVDYLVTDERTLHVSRPLS